MTRKLVTGHELVDAVTYLRAADPADMTIAAFMRARGLHPDISLTGVPAARWRQLRDAELRRRIDTGITSLLPAARIRTDLSAEKVAREAGLLRNVVVRLASRTLKDRQRRLPTATQRVLAVIDEMVAEATPRSQFTWLAIVERAGCHPGDSQRLVAAYRSAVARLPRDDGATLDLDADSWHLRSVNASRHRLRADLRDLAWSLLRAKLARPGASVGAAAQDYNAYRHVGLLLGTEVPDIGQVTLAALQRAWAVYDASESQQRSARTGLTRLCEAHRALAHQRGDQPRAVELGRVLGWLRGAVRIERTRGSAFLTQDELDRLIAACAADIERGLAANAEETDLLSASPQRTDGVVALFATWSVALTILVGALTGLRPASLADLRTGDLASLQPGLDVVAWRHSKKDPPEESVAVLPGFAADHLRLFIRATEPVRQALGSDAIFVTSGSRGDWVTLDARTFHSRLVNFARRHGLRRDDGPPLPLTATMLRRTFVTRALAEGRSIWAIAAQLGHRQITTTLGYAKFDRVEHAAATRHALDEFGRSVLSPWHAPAMLSELDAKERDALLGTKRERDQGVGLCRHDHCVEQRAGAPPPCSLCSQLVTGPEFLPAWESEHRERLLQIEQFDERADFRLASASAAAYLRAFERNLAHVREAPER